MEKSDTPLIKYIPDFLDYCEIERGLSSNTQKNYEHYLKKFSSWLKENRKTDIKPYELTDKDIWNFRLYLSRHKDPNTQKTLKKITQHYYLIALRALLAYFTEKNIASLPQNKVKLPKYAKDEITVKFLTLEQIEKLLLSPTTNTNSGLRDRAILESLFSTGLRVAELAILNRDQINTKKQDMELSIVGKGGYQRTIYFSERALEWLKKYLGTRSDNDSALFIHYRSRKDVSSRRLSMRSIERIVQKYSKIAGLPILATPHTLRHSYATDLLTQGVDLRTVQEFLGHRSIVTTQIYTHITSKRLRDIHRKFHSGKKLKDE